MILGALLQLLEILKAQHTRQWAQRNGVTVEIYNLIPALRNIPLTAHKYDLAKTQEGHTIHAINPLVPFLSLHFQHRLLKRELSRLHRWGWIGEILLTLVIDNVQSAWPFPWKKEERERRDIRQRTRIAQLEAEDGSSRGR